jgi:uncharacterized membrane protein YbhN (UPF0104 family)
LASGLSSLKSSRRIAVVMALAVVQWGLMAVGIYISIAAVGIDIGLSAAFVVLAFVFAGVTLPSTPGAVGTIQLGFTLALTPFGVSSGSAVAASVFWHVLAYCFVVSLGLFFFVRMGYSVREIREHSQVDPAADTL